MKLSERWLQSYVNVKYEVVPQQVALQPKPQCDLTVQMDELGSVVDDKDKAQWVWLAIDTLTREIVGCYIGDPSGASAQKLWESLPAVYRHCAICYTDFCSSYLVAVPSKRHRALGKASAVSGSAELTVEASAERIVAKQARLRVSTAP